MCEPDSQALKFTGQYTGEGAWTDITGESKRYRVRQTIAAEGNRLIVSYTHSFFEEGTSSGGELHFDFVAGSIFTTTMNGTVVG